MTIHLFNPEHDIALASNLANFTAPHAGRQLRADLGFLPALWAEEGDTILVGNGCGDGWCLVWGLTVSCRETKRL